MALSTPPTRLGMAGRGGMYSDILLVTRGDVLLVTRGDVLLVVRGRYGVYTDRIDAGE